MENIVTGIDKR